MSRLLPSLPSGKNACESSDGEHCESQATSSLRAEGEAIQGCLLVACCPGLLRCARNDDHAPSFARLRWERERQRLQRRRTLPLPRGEGEGEGVQMMSVATACLLIGSAPSPCPSPFGDLCESPLIRRGSASQASPAKAAGRGGCFAETSRGSGNRRQPHGMASERAEMPCLVSSENEHHSTPCSSPDSSS